MKLSILTATFNRAKMLDKLYKSIIENMKNVKNLEVEWIIIDDGSTDNTKEKVSDFIKDTKEFKYNNQTKKNYGIKIIYVYQINGGKMLAINNGMKYVTGDLIIDCDSDDYFDENAFAYISENADILLKKSNIYGLCFLKQTEDGVISGKKFDTNYKETKMFDLYFKDDIKGEKVLVFDSNIRKKFEHKLEFGEKFVTEARMYHEMDAYYNIICINEIIEIGNYHEDGYTKNILKTFRESPKGYYKYFREIVKKGLNGVKLDKKIYILKNLFWFGLIYKMLKVKRKWE